MWVLATVLLVGLVPLVGTGGAGPADDPLVLVTDTVCGVEEAAEVLCEFDEYWEEAWVARYDNANFSDGASAIALSPDGSRAFVTGESRTESNTDSLDYTTVAYDVTSGEELWVSHYDGASGMADTPKGIGVSADGSRVFVTGTTFNLTGFAFDTATIAYDAETGDELWAALFVGSDDFLAGWTFVEDLAVSPDDSKVFVTGTLNSGSSAGREDFATVAYDASTGAELWVSLYDGPANHNDEPADIGVSANGSHVFVTGVSRGDGSLGDFATVAYDATSGDELWVARFDGPLGGHDVARAMHVDADGSRLFVTGATRDASNDYATVAYNTTTGEQLWFAQFDGGGFNDIAHAIGASADGSRVFVTGDSHTTGSSTSNADFGTVAYDAATGEQLWVTMYNGPAGHADIPAALGVAPDGSHVFVTGPSKGEASGADYATLVYDATTGDELWAFRYNGTANADDTPSGLAVGADGRTVVVAGQSRGEDTLNDFATVAYRLIVDASLVLL